MLCFLPKNNLIIYFNGPKSLHDRRDTSDMTRDFTVSTEQLRATLYDTETDAVRKA